MTQPAVHPRSGFTPCYIKALAGAALAFGLSHAGQALVVSASRYGLSHPRFDALLSLSFFELLEAIIFFIVAVVAALLPAKVADSYISVPTTKMVSLFGWLGALAGVTYLPLCAGVSASILPSIDDPTYLQRCIEYLLPMALAGIVGGRLFGSCRAAYLGDERSVGEEKGLGAKAR